MSSGYSTYVLSVWQKKNFDLNNTIDKNYLSDLDNCDLNTDVLSSLQISLNKYEYIKFQSFSTLQLLMSWHIIAISRHSTYYKIGHNPGYKLFH